MTWAGNKRLLIIAGILFVIFIVLAVILVLTLPQKPSCVDGLQNQDEAGVDCGGACERLCEDDIAKPSISYIRALEQSGRIDVVALIENNEPNTFATNVPFTVEVFSPEGTLVGSQKGVVDLPAGEEVPVFIPGVAPSGVVVGRAFISFEGSVFNWKRTQEERKLPRADAIRAEDAEIMPRVSANIFNPSVDTLRDLVVVAVVRDVEGNIMAASQTVVEELRPEASEPVVFTWNEPFLGPAGQIEIRALVPLP
jgi:hypothetical protein